MQRWTTDAPLEHPALSRFTLGRFANPPMLILARLAGSPKQGSAIQEDLAAFAGVHLGPGTVFGAIARLETAGLLEPLPAEERRRPARFTASGVALLHEPLTDLEPLASLGVQRFARRGG